MNDEPASVEAADVERALEAGCTEAMLYDAATVCGIFNFFNRWIDATGVPGVPEGFYEDLLARHGDSGYAP